MGEAKWIPTGEFRTSGKPVLKEVKVPKTRPEDNEPPAYFPEGSQARPPSHVPTIRGGVGNYNADIVSNALDEKQD